MAGIKPGTESRKSNVQPLDHWASKVVLAKSIDEVSL